MRNDIEAFSERIGRDPLLIQGAGGNVSWKDGNALWVKASGAWLANARTEDMFVPVDLLAVRRLIDAGHESYGDHRLFGSPLRPSIETALHALMPQRVVAHLHAVDAIAFAVMRDGPDALAQRLSGVAWMWVPYRKPGASLASQIAWQLRSAERLPDVLILANHGIVFCGADATRVDDLYHDVLARLQIVPRPIAEAPRGGDDRTIPGYVEVATPGTRTLATDAIGVAFVQRRWVMYPDHAVFLGPAAQVYPSLPDAVVASGAAGTDGAAQRPCIVVVGDGVWLAAGTPVAAEAMLGCYADVCRRLASPDVATALDDSDVAALLNWEAETYRKSIAR